MVISHAKYIIIIVTNKIKYFIDSR